MSYVEEFKSAVSRSNENGIDVTFPLIKRKPYLDKKTLNKYSRFFSQKFTDIGYEAFKGQCLAISQATHEYLEEKVKIPSILTFGYVVLDDDDYFKQDENFYSALVRNPSRKQSENIHAWVTLTSGEIIDPTFATSYAYAHGIEEMKGSVVSGYADKLNKGMSYHPMIVGSDFLIKAGFIRIGRFALT
ncbi:putative TmRNA [Candidatus Terasakiella magnetica]|uniref:Putative TmRNA n=1 Tax=Candidatus Terasakiella magnetica TaxID=1867952 RepID=A0A1C3RLV3_9PROT|nr:hypothetical protein [Candidatus Terasakiella magnetica]SCA58119.1 putative TmRNA [Candidatus Terasakiella magnetica]